MPTPHNLALLITNPNTSNILISKQPRPPKFNIPEYDSYIDTDLWDLPSVQLLPLPSPSNSPSLHLENAESFSDKIDFKNFDVASALKKVVEELGIGDQLVGGKWKVVKYVEEPEFGPGPPVNTVFISTEFGLDGINVACQWVSRSKCVEWLLEVKEDSTRVGPLVIGGLLHDDSGPFLKWHVPESLRYQEFPLGVRLVPMGSNTAKPFRTTNLIVFSPNTVANTQSDEDFVAHGEALIVDPGCSSQFHQELRGIVASLPRKLIVFVTHHHYDHVDGLSAIQEQNPDAILLAHENTMRRIRKGHWSLGYTLVTGGEAICVGGQRLRVISAPGHTDGHMALLHENSQTLIVGDHCVGQGSALLDSRAGGNMADYFRTTYRFLELSPHALIPMHGRVNFWPKHMLCGYLKNRRDREYSVLKAIESGRITLFDIVDTIYKDADRRLWWAAASNVKLHVEHLAELNQLPEGFCLETYKSSIDTFAEDMSKL